MPGVKNQLCGTVAVPTMFLFEQKDALYYISTSRELNVSSGIGRRGLLHMPQ
jgi:hypothetical protein